MIGNSRFQGHGRRKTMTGLLQRYSNVMEQLEALAEARLDLEVEIIASMQRDGATEWADGPHMATLKVSNSYVQDKLAPILELVPEADLVTGKAYMPSHEKTIQVEPRWNLTKLKPFTRRGRAIQDVIDAATIKGAPRLRVEQKEAPQKLAL
jgi:hypothetical protein